MLTNKQIYMKLFKRKTSEAKDLRGERPQRRKTSEAKDLRGERPQRRKTSEA